MEEPPSPTSEIPARAEPVPRAPPPSADRAEPTETHHMTPSTPESQAEILFTRVRQPGAGRSMKDRWTGSRVRVDGTVEMMRRGEWTALGSITPQSLQQIQQSLDAMAREGVPAVERPQRPPRGGSHEVWTLTLPDGERTVTIPPGGSSAGLAALERLAALPPKPSSVVLTVGGVEHVLPCSPMRVDGLKGVFQTLARARDEGQPLSKDSTLLLQVAWFNDGEPTSTDRLTRDGRIIRTHQDNRPDRVRWLDQRALTSVSEALDAMDWSVIPDSC